MKLDAQADIIAVIGATGTGKTTWVKRALLRPRPARLLIWSSKPDYEEFAPGVDGFVQFADKVRLSGKYSAGIRPSWDTGRRAAEFDRFCRLAMAAGNCTVIVEELHMVTSPAHAPEAWQRLTCMGRAYGVRIIGTSQRPQHMDKDFLGNATRVQCFRVNDDAAQRVMARALSVKLSDVQGLPNYKAISRDNTSGIVTLAR